MLTPGFLGYWADSSWGTSPGLMLIGFAFGFVYGLWRLIALGQQTSTNDPSDDLTPPHVSD